MNERILSWLYAIIKVILLTLNIFMFFMALLQLGNHWIKYKRKQALLTVLRPCNTVGRKEGRAIMATPHWTGKETLNRDHPFSRTMKATGLTKVKFVKKKKEPSQTKITSFQTLCPLLFPVRCFWRHHSILLEEKSLFILILLISKNERKYWERMTGPICWCSTSVWSFKNTSSRH